MFHLFVGSVNDLNSTWNILLPLQLFIVYLYQCELIDTYFILSVTIQYCGICFVAQAFQLWLLETHSVDPMSL